MTVSPVDIKQIKQAPESSAVIDIIKNRFSPRAFSNEEITQAEIDIIIEAAHWAPSAMNEQPWRYQVALKNNTQAFKNMVSVLAPGNEPWAKQAAALILCSIKSTYSSNNKINTSALHDLGMANQNLLLQALSMNIYAHVIGGFDKAKAIDVFSIDEEINPVCIIALGYLGNHEHLTEPYKERELKPRTRLPIKDILEYL
jgi:nitroreductase